MPHRLAIKMETKNYTVIPESSTDTARLPIQHKKISLNSITENPQLNGEGLKSTTVIVATDGSRPANMDKGSLMCDGVDIGATSEVVYWKVVPGDNEFESPITPHHGEHHTKYITFEYDQGGW